MAANQSIVFEAPQELRFKKTGLTDDTYADMIRVFVPNNTIAGWLELKALIRPIGADLGEIARYSEWVIVFGRVADGAADETHDERTFNTTPAYQLAATPGAATCTLALNVEAVAGSNSGQQYFDIQLKGNNNGSTQNEVYVVAELHSTEPGDSGLKMLAV